MSFTLHGVGVSGGIAIGRAHLLAHSIEEVSHYAIAESDIAQEILRFDAAVATVREELQSLQRAAPVGAPDELNAFLNLHLMILNDEMLTETPRTLIKQQRCNAEWALKQQTDALFDEFEAIEDAYLRGTSETEEDHIERLRRKNKKKQWKRQRVREFELARLSGKIVSTRKEEDDEYYFDAEQRLRSWAKRVRR